MSRVPRDFIRIVSYAFILLVMANALAVGLRTVSDTDMGWHLATGRYVMQHHKIPETDVLSYTSYGKPWAYPPFAGVLLYLIYNASGYAGISWFCAFACAGVVGYLMRRGDVPSVALAMLAIEPIAFRTGPRADLFSTVFFALFLGELWAFHCGLRARLWFLPLAMLFWVNLHPGFIVGLAVIASYLLIEGLDLFFSDRRRAVVQRLRLVWPWLAGTVAATVLNPWGVKLYAASLTLAGSMGAAPGTLNSSVYINEFLSVPLSFELLKHLVDLRHPENGYCWLMVVAVVTILLALWRKHLGVAVVQAAALYGSLLHARYIALFCITTVTFASVLLAEEFAAESPTNSSAEIAPISRPRVCVPNAVAMILVSALCGIVILHINDFVSNRTYVVFDPNSRFGAGESPSFPERAASFIRRERLPGNIYEEFALGGFAAWRLGPEYPDFIDGRADRLNPVVFAQQRELQSQGPDSNAWQAAANRWGINVLLISEVGAKAVDRLDVMPFCKSTTWRPVYMDEVSMVLLRNIPENRPWLDRMEIECQTQQFVPPASSSQKQSYDFLFNSGALLYALGRDQEAEQMLLRAAATFPEDPNSHLVLAELYQRREMFPRAEAEYNASLTRSNTDKSWYELGRLYSKEARLHEAETAFQSAARISVTPCIPYMALAQIELALKQPERSLSAFAKAEENSPYRRGGEALAPELYAEIADGRADAHVMLSQTSEAILFQEEAVRLTPFVADRWNRLADLYASGGKLELSARARQRAHDLESRSFTGR